MKKKQFLEILHTFESEPSGASALKTFLFQENIPYLTTYYSYVQKEYVLLWAGDHLCHLRKKHKMTESQFMALFALQNDLNQNWSDYISRQDANVCRAFLNILQHLFEKGLLSLANFLELLFGTRNQGTFVTRLVKYQDSQLVMQFFSILDLIVNKESGQRTLQGLMTKIDQGWTFLHLLAHYHLEETFLYFFSLLSKWLEKDFLEGQQILKFLSIETDADLLAFHLAKNTTPLVPILSLILLIYEKSKSCVTDILNLLGHRKPRNLLYYFFKFKNASQMKNFLDQIYQQDPEHLINFISSLAHDKTKNSFNLLTESENLKFYSLLIRKLKDYIENNHLNTKKLPFDPLTQLFLKQNAGGLNHLHIVVKAGNKIPMQKILYIYRILLKNDQRLREANFLEFVLSEPDKGWTILHLAARYLNSESMQKLFTFILEKLKRLGMLQENETPLHTYLLKLFSENQPSFFYLLLTFQPIEVTHFILQSIKMKTLSNRELRLAFLRAFYSNLDLILSEKPLILKELQVFVEAHIERMYDHIDELNDNEISCLKMYTPFKHCSAAHYILYKYFKLKKDSFSQEHFREALENEYLPASLENFARELGSFPYIDKQDKFRFFYSVTDPLRFTEVLAKRRKFLTDSDYLLLLQNYLALLEKDTPHNQNGSWGKEIIRFEIGNYYYDLAQIQTAWMHFQKITLDVATLSGEQHYLLSIFYRHANDLKKYRADLYSAIKHLHFAIYKKYQISKPDEDFMHQERQVHPALYALFSLEQTLVESHIPGLIAFAPQLRQAILSEIIACHTQTNETKIVNLCALLTGWFNDEKNIDTEYMKYLKEQKSTHSYFFSLIPNNLLSHVTRLYHLIKDSRHYTSTPTHGVQNA